MRQFVKHFSVVLCLTYMLNQWAFVFPYLEYYVNYEYIAEVLCINQDKPELECNGKCHLKETIREEADEDSGNSPNTASDFKQEYSLHIATADIQKNPEKPRNTAYADFNLTLPSQFSEEITHPPEASLS